MGIPLNKQGIIFDRFGQVDQAKEYRPSGTGLGLPISKNLVKLMGGEMWVDSLVNEGSTFFFTLPMVMEKTADEPEMPISNKSYNWKGTCILVAEDEPLNWLFIKEMISKSGAEVLRAKNGREAIRITKETNPDVILMDLKMPEVSGIEATRTIRGFNTGVPIIAQTAYVMAEEKEESRQAGCNFFITKPLDRTELMELIDNCLKQGK
jgi:CheY-like chemotaxis protein